MGLGALGPPPGSAGASLRSAPINYSYRILCETKDSVFQLSFTRLQNFPLSLGRRGGCLLCFVRGVGGIGLQSAPGLQITDTIGEPLARPTEAPEGAGAGGCSDIFV